MLPSITLAYTTEGTLDQRMDAIAGAGFGAINLPSDQCRHLICSGLAVTREFKAAIRKRNLVVDWVHAPFRVPVLYDAGQDIFPLSVATAKTAIQVAAEIEAGSVVLHPFDKNFPSDIDHADRIDQLTRTLSVLVEFGEAHSVRVAVENIDEPYSQKILTALFTRIDDLSFCFDTGHAHLWASWDAYLPRFADRLTALHIHDNNGEADEHLIPGDGAIDFVRLVKLLKACGYAGYLGLECAQGICGFPGDRDELAHCVWQRVQDILTAS